MNILYVDDEQPALDNFKLTIKRCEGVDDLALFLDGKKALEWANSHEVDVAFLDVEMTKMQGISLAKKLRKIKPNIHIIFVTAYTQYALDAFSVDAIGYVLKPYSVKEIQKHLDRAASFTPVIQEKAKIEIETIPDFVFKVNGKAVYFSRSKVEELLALLVDRGENGLTTGDAITHLWPERSNDIKTQTLFRVTFKRLLGTLSELEVEYIIEVYDRKKYLKTELVDCDLYRILDGETEVGIKYTGEYMKNYSWAESRIAQLDRLLSSEND